MRMFCLLLAAILCLSSACTLAESASFWDDLLNGASELEDSLSDAISSVAGKEISLEDAAKELIDSLPENWEAAKAAASGMLSEAETALDQLIAVLAEGEFVPDDALMAFFKDELKHLQDSGIAAAEWLQAQGQHFIESDFFSDRPVSESLSEMLGIKHETGENFAVFLSNLLNADIHTGSELKAALAAWLKTQEESLAGFADAYLYPLIGSTLFCLFMVFGGAAGVVIGEISPAEYLDFCRMLSAGWMDVLHQLSNGGFMQDTPN